jgi:tetratricopeptide (TPR) repeat protein
MLLAGESAFLSLQRLARSCDRVRAGERLTDAEETAVRQLTVRLGGRAVALLTRRLARAFHEELEWTLSLLVELLADEDLVPRVLGALRENIACAHADDTSKMLSLALLAELGDDELAGDDGDGQASVNERSLEELASHLDDRQDVARAADYLVSELEPIDLLEVVNALCLREGERAGALVDEMLARDDVHEQIRGELSRVAAPIRDRRASNRKPPVRATGALRVAIGESPAGTTVLVTSQPLVGSRPPRRRALICELSREGQVVGSLYREDFTPRGVEREIIARLEREGFSFETVTAAAARQRLADAALATHNAGRQLPRGFYLGRDILDLSDEHIGARRRALVRDHASALLGRGADILADGDYAEARPLLERYTQIAPRDPEGAANLGSCLLALGDTDGAVEALRRATELGPECALHYWNLAAALHRAKRRAGSYLALRAYLEHLGDGVEPPTHIEIATSFVADYERCARLEFPCTAPVTVARVEELLIEAGARLCAGEFAAGLTLLRRAVAMAPEHHLAWTALGEAYAARGQDAKAIAAFRSALQSRADHEPADRGLAQLLAKRTAAPARRLPVSRPAAKRKNASAGRHDAAPARR